MPNLMLSLHPDSHSPVTRIAVNVARIAPDLLGLTYFVSGDLDRITIPPARASAPADGLWQNTCFEAFLGARQGYYEFNLSPSTQWAAYRFDGYRAGMRDAPMRDPAIAWERAAGDGTLSATLRLPAGVTGPLGLSAVIEDEDGGKAYWALAFPPGAPDFHHAACFAAELPPAD